VGNNAGQLPVSKIVLLISVVAVVIAVAATAAVSVWLLWATRSDALPGTYRVEGVWGASTLTLRADHTFTQEVQFIEYDEPERPPYRQHPTRHQVIEGRWEERGRDRGFSLDRKLQIKPFINLGPWHQGEVWDSFDVSYGMVQLSGLGIEVDMGSDIVYRK
jgi:hypothetical protein